MPDSQVTNPQSREHQFATTQWSVVLAAADSDASGFAAALESLCQSYWRPIYAYLRRRGNSPTDSCDLTQGFFADVIRKRLPGRADPSRGRFRAFMLAALKQFLFTEKERANRQKRGGGQVHFSIDVDDAERDYREDLALSHSEERVFDRSWAALVFDSVMDRVRKEYEEAGQADRFQALCSSMMRSEEAAPYAELAPKLGLSEDGVKSAARRLRLRFRDLFREHVARLVQDPKDVNDEIRHLISVLGQSSRSESGGDERTGAGS